jgi:hypothetical protein
MKKKKYSRVRIEDEFTHLPVSRGRKYQLRRHKEGKCIKCGQPQVTAFFCLEHMIASREAIRRRSGATKRLHSLSYRLEEKAKVSRRARVRRSAKSHRH